MHLILTSCLYRLQRAVSGSASNKGRTFKVMSSADRSYIYALKLIVSFDLRLPYSFFFLLSCLTPFFLPSSTAHSYAFHAALDGRPHYITQIAACVNAHRSFPLSLLYTSLYIYLAFLSLSYAFVRDLLILYAKHAYMA